MLPPKPWCWEGICDAIGEQPIDMPAEVPWSCIKVMECNPDTVVLRYVEPAFYNLTPNWLTMEDMLARAFSAGENVMMTGVRDIDQFIEHNQRALFLATQSRYYGGIPRAMVAVEKVKEKQNTHVVWPRLDDVRVLDFNPGIAPVGRGRAYLLPRPHPTRSQRGSGKSRCPRTVLSRGVA
jgi:hypothetical protein